MGRMHGSYCLEYWNYQKHFKSSPCNGLHMVFLCMKKTMTVGLRIVVTVICYLYISHTVQVTNILLSSPSSLIPGVEY